MKTMWVAAVAAAATWLSVPAAMSENTTSFEAFRTVTCRGYERPNTVRHGFCIGLVEGIATMMINEQPACRRLQEEWKSNALTQRRIAEILSVDPADYPKQTGQAVEKWLRETFNCPRLRS